MWFYAINVLRTSSDCARIELKGRTAVTFLFQSCLPALEETENTIRSLFAYVLWGMKFFRNSIKVSAKAT